MMTRTTTTRTMKISDVRSELNSLVNRVYHGETRVLIEKSGIPVAVIVSLKDLRLIEQVEERRQEAFAVLDAIGAGFKDVTEEEIERETAKALAEVRAEMRAERAAQLESNGVTE